MTPLRRRAYLSCILLLATSVAFSLTAVVALPVPLYLPLSRRFVLGATAELAMDYYGRSLFALAVGAAAGLLAHLVLRSGRAARPSGRPMLLLCMAWSVTAFLFCASLYAYKLMGRDPAASSPPLVLPDPGGKG